MVSVPCNGHIWRPVQGFEERYSVNDVGDIIDLSRGALVSHYKDRDGYHVVHLSAGDGTFTKRVHRIVALAFIPNPLRKPTVNHIDENKDNNSVSNLEWATYREQVHHGSRTLRAKDTIDSCKVLQIDSSGEIVRCYQSVREAAKAMGVRPAIILHSLKGRQRESCGFHWQYCGDNQHSISGRKKPKGILQLTLGGKLIARYCSIRSAAKALSISPAGISECLQGRRRTNKGFIWKEDPSPLPEFGPAATPIDQFDLNGSFLNRFPSISEAARAVHGTTGMICKCLDGRRNTYHGFCWKRAV